MDRNIEMPRIIEKAVPALLGVTILAGLSVSSLYSYLLFHTLVELFCIVTAFVIFVIAWHTRRIQDNRYLLFIGIASLSVGAIELAHTLAYKGMGVFPGYSADLPTQLWIAFRYVFSISLLLAPFFITHSFNALKALAVYGIITIAVLYTVFAGLFPACFVEGSGLTPFKIYSEYVIALLFVADLGLLMINRKSLDRTVFGLMAGSIVSSIASELAFTKYVSVFGPANMIGHFFLLASMVLIYRALVITGIVEPSSLLFRNLKLSEEKIQALNSELKQNVLQLEAANRELESFAYSVSHDLRAPLRSISGFAQAIEEDLADRLDETGKSHLQRIRGSAQRMSELIDALLDLSRMSRCELWRESVDLSALAKKEAGELTRTQPGRAVEFVIADGITAEGDPVMLRAVMENLLGNAWKFTSRRGDAKIEFGVVQKNGSNAFFVKDNGAGFDVVYANKLFTAFQRLHPVEDYPGLGIGLTTVQRIIHRHGGRIWAEGEVAKGAVFYFTLN